MFSVLNNEKFCRIPLLSLTLQNSKEISTCFGFNTVLFSVNWCIIFLKTRQRQQLTLFNNLLFLCFILTHHCSLFLRFFDFSALTQKPIKTTQNFLMLKTLDKLKKLILFLVTHANIINLISNFSQNSKINTKSSVTKLLRCFSL